ncbi:MAG: class I SAM-dependent methyltransferase [Chloroflexi bacterium]|nr:class I SAM-dependent methyltransferase [Chloroflexota bacterium]
MDEQPAAVDAAVLDRQQDHWTRTFDRHPGMFGTDTSEPARAALEQFRREGTKTLLELGAGQGRDTLPFAAQGLHVTALDYAASALDEIAVKAAAAGLADLIHPMHGDVREPLPFGDQSFEAAYAHMLFCMALTTPELERLAGEVRRVLRPGGLVVYTVRTKRDPHFGAGVDRGNDMFEMGGFIVHFFDRALVERLADGFELLEVAEFEEAALPRRLYRVTMRKPSEGRGDRPEGA